MRTALLGALMGAGLAVAALVAILAPREAAAQHVDYQRPTDNQQPTDAERELFAFCTVVDDTYQQLTVIDPERRVISVYHVDLATGAVELKCVRTIQWDLQMVHYNGKGLLPQDIHSLQEPR